MAANGAEKQYKFGTKNNWRRTVWNELQSRVTKPADAIVLYLAGAMDLDSQIAREKGFAANNLIAIERDATALRALRGARRLAIAGDFCEILWDWPEERTLDIAFGDFCCGLETQLANKLLMLTLAPKFKSTCFVFNFLRGRDQSSNQFRSNVDSVGPMMQSKHRAEYFVLHCYGAWMRGGVMATGGNDDWDTEIIDAHVRANQPTFDLLHRRFGETVKPRFLSYRSTSGQTFDSVIMNSMAPAHCPEWRTSDWKNVAKAWGMRSAGRRIAAVMAHRTMRSGSH